MSLPTSLVQATFCDAQGRPIAGMSVSVILVGAALDGDAYVTGRRHYSRTDDTGRVAFSLWPNSRGDRPSFYGVTVRDASGALYLRGSAKVPASAEPVNLLSILDVHP